LILLLSLEGRWLLGVLSDQSPSYLRRQLIEPDPVVLHDWNIDREQYVGLVRLALEQQ
jgi:hypothetical protein